ncbi:hypothetical protein R9C00_07110 [Flammeovirgaceae bacterium SG7u.111]|nr:hypothetical protein [Flammeovirgaceae bacterium SG7u.132]WPO37213.1 hypothetical protein R9C00_07110 [Flammeovirgaceae bacterium SG7u.111]
MKTTKQLVLVTLLIISSSFAIAQTNTLDAQTNLNQIGTLTPNTVGALGFDNRYEGVKGSPFLFEEWIPCEIYLENGTEYKEGLKLNYNAENDEIHLLSPNKTVRILYSTQIKKFVATGNSGAALFVRFKPTELGLKEGRELFCEVLYDGETKLVKKTNVIYKKANYEGAYAQGKTYDEYQKTDKLYIKTKNGYEKIGLSKGAVMKLFPEKKSELKGYFKKLGKGIDTEKELVEALIFIES